MRGVGFVLLTDNVLAYPQKQPPHELDHGLVRLVPLYDLINHQRAYLPRWGVVGDAVDQTLSGIVRFRQTVAHPYTVAVNFKRNGQVEGDEGVGELQVYGVVAAV